MARCCRRVRWGETMRYERRNTGCVHVDREFDLPHPWASVTAYGAKCVACEAGCAEGKYPQLWYVLNCAEWMRNVRDGRSFARWGMGSAEWIRARCAAEQMAALMRKELRAARLRDYLASRGNLAAIHALGLS